MRQTVLLGALVAAAIGCGDPGSSSGDAGADPNTVCRAPTGCSARIESGGCLYGCPPPEGGTQNQTVCVPLPDGGAAQGTDFPPDQVVPLALVQTQRPFATVLRDDPANCGRCGRRCAVGQRCGVPPGGNLVDCYTPRF